tara:strand:+ start:227 stop:628 length:402 start_codon:yes stop_codon:yes gene_type:complete
MATYFAKLDDDNTVLSVHAVDDKDGATEEAGVTFLTNLHGWINWKQTSYTNSFRKEYAGIGFKYDSAKDKFIRNKPYTSWLLDSNDDWAAPVAYPSVIESGETKYFPLWDEDNQRWHDQDTGSIWNHGTSSWD